MYFPIKGAKMNINTVVIKLLITFHFKLPVPRLLKCAGNATALINSPIATVNNIKLKWLLVLFRKKREMVSDKAKGDKKKIRLNNKTSLKLAL